MRKAHPDGVARARRALREIANIIANCDGVYLIGGQTFRLMCEDDSGLQHRGTLDIDILFDNTEIEMNEVRAVIEEILKSGFQRSEYYGSFRLTKDYDGKPVQLDLLTTEETGDINATEVVHPQHFPDAVVIKSDVMEIEIPGLSDEDEPTIIRVPGFNAALVLKTVAYKSRGEDKDIIDIYYLLYHYPGDVANLVAFIKPLLFNTNLKVRESFVYLDDSVANGNAVDVITGYVISTKSGLSTEDASIIRSGIKRRLNNLLVRLFG